MFLACGGAWRGRRHPWAIRHVNCHEDSALPNTHMKSKVLDGKAIRVMLCGATMSAYLSNKLPND